MIENYLNTEFCDPFDNVPQNFFMKLEHCGRYLYAFDKLSKSDIVADIACATGYGTKLLSSKVKNIFGIDINENYLKIARKKYPDLRFLQLDLNSDFDLTSLNATHIVSFETIEHSPEPCRLVDKFYQMLPEHGKLYLSFPNAKCEFLDETGASQDPYHLSVIEFEKMIAFMEKTGFKIHKILGQSLVNKIILQVLQIEQDLQISLDTLYNYTKKNILSQSRILAYPNNIDVHNSYSFIIEAEKL